MQTDIQFPNLQYDAPYRTMRTGKTGTGPVLQLATYTDTGGKTWTLPVYADPNSDKVAEVEGYNLKKKLSEGGGTQVLSEQLYGAQLELGGQEYDGGTLEAVWDWTVGLGESVVDNTKAAVGAVAEGAGKVVSSVIPWGWILGGTVLVAAVVGGVYVWRKA